MSAALVETVQLRPVEIPLAQPAELASATLRTTPVVLINIRTSDGLCSRSYLRTYSALALRGLATLLDDVAGLLVGQPAAPEALEPAVPRISAHLLAVSPTAHWLEHLDHLAPIREQGYRIENCHVQFLRSLASGYAGMRTLSTGCSRVKTPGYKTTTAPVACRIRSRWVAPSRPEEVRMSSQDSSALEAKPLPTGRDR